MDDVYLIHLSNSDNFDLQDRKKAISEDQLQRTIKLLSDIHQKIYQETIDEHEEGDFQAELHGPFAFHSPTNAMERCHHHEVIRDHYVTTLHFSELDVWDMINQSSSCSAENCPWFFFHLQLYFTISIFKLKKWIDELNTGVRLLWLTSRSIIFLSRNTIRRHYDYFDPPPKIKGPLCSGNGYTIFQRGEISQAWRICSVYLLCKRLEMDMDVVSVTQGGVQRSARCRCQKLPDQLPSFLQSIPAIHGEFFLRYPSAS